MFRSAAWSMYKYQGSAVRPTVSRAQGMQCSAEAASFHWKTVREEQEVLLPAAVVESANAMWEAQYGGEEEAINGFLGTR